MAEQFRPDSRLVHWIETIGELVILNVLWLVTSIPLFTLGASTTALYHAVISLKEGRGRAAPTEFFRSFWNNFFEATIMLLIMLIPLLMAVGYYLAIYFDAIILPIWLRIVLFIPANLILLAAGWVFPQIAVYQNNYAVTIRNALLLAVARFPQSLAMLAVHSVPALMLLFHPPWLIRTAMFWLLLGFSLSAYLNAIQLKALFQLNEKE